jgi:hypothetical protein
MGKGRREKSGIDLDGITVLGVMRASREVTELTRKKRKNANLGKPQLLYAMTKSRPEAKIVNSIQNSGMILSNSKTLYFSKALCIFRYFDHRKIQLAYCGNLKYIFAFLFKLTQNKNLSFLVSDTDSLIIAVTSKNLEELMREEFRHLFEPVCKFLFEDETSDVSQHGLFKM